MAEEFTHGDILRHFKRETADPEGTEYLYLYLGTAEHTETGEKLVIYRALYGEQRVFARPYEMFYGETDHDKYPQYLQKYRFEYASDTDLKALGK